MPVTDEKLLSAYKAAALAAADYAAKASGEILVRAKRYLRDCIFAAAEKNTRVPCYDACLFEYNELTIEGYRDVLNHEESAEEAQAVLNSEPNSTPNSAAEIWRGITEVLASRVKLFEERVGVNHRYGGNPVLQEKKAVIEKSVRTFSEGFDNWIGRYQGAPQWFFSADNLIDKVYNAVETACFTRFYEFYASTVKFALFGLSDLNVRAEARFYRDMLFEERNILGMVVDIQLTALEAEAGESLGAYARRIAALREANGRLVQRAGEIEGFGKTYGEPVNEDELRRILREKFDEYKRHIGLVLQDEETALVSALNEYNAAASGFIEDKPAAAAKSAVSKAGYAFNKEVFLTKAVTTDVYDEFTRLSIFCAENGALFGAESVGEREAAIIAGVAESVKIKLEGIDEQLKTFAQEARAFIDGFFAEADGLMNSAGDSPETGELGVLFAAELAKKPPECAEDITNAISAFFDGAGRGFIDSIEKFFHKQTDALNKKIAAYKRDYLLYEVSTFEEIINYSIAVLRESPDENTLMFVAATDRVYAGIFKALAKHGIQIIKPNPREMFDGKEHEVLTAETLEGYAKGEIIKVLNCGYRQNGEVLLRANVVAAK